MKNSIKLILLIIPFSISMTVSAQQYPGAGMGGQPDMKNVMATMQKAQSCMKKIDKKKIMELDRKSRVFTKKIQALCTKGKRAEAEKISLKFAEAMMREPISKELQKCSKIMINMVPDSAGQEIHACDDIQSGDMAGPPGGMSIPPGY